MKVLRRSDISYHLDGKSIEEVCQTLRKMCDDKGDVGSNFRLNYDYDDDKYAIFLEWEEEETEVERERRLYFEEQAAVSRRYMYEKLKKEFGT